MFNSIHSYFFKLPLLLRGLPSFSHHFLHLQNVRQGIRALVRSLQVFHFFGRRISEIVPLTENRFLLLLVKVQAVLGPLVTIIYLCCKTIDLICKTSSVVSSQLCLLVQLAYSFLLLPHCVLHRVRFV